NFSSTNHHDLTADAVVSSILCEALRFIQVMCNQYTFRYRPVVLARHHDVSPPRQRSTNGLIGLAPHDDWFSHRHRLEVLQVLRQMPWQPIFTANHIVGCSSNN